MRRLRPRQSLLLLSIAAVALVACSSGSAEADKSAVVVATTTPVPTAAPPTPGPTRAVATAIGGATVAPATATSAASEPTGTSTATPRPATPVPAPTQLPAALATPSGSIQFKPTQIEQGGMAVVYLNEAATSATLTFQGRQYPMLASGGRWWAIIGTGAFTEPGLHPVSVSYVPPGSTTSASVVASLSVLDHDYPVENIELDPTTAALLAPEIVQAELAKRAAIYAGYTTQRYWSGPFVAPSQGAFSSRYGEARSYNGGPVTDYHRGTDFVGDRGDPVVSAAAGRVVFTGELQVRGNTVIIDHGAGVFTAYHHLSRIDVVEGAGVTLGQQIGAIGSTGLVTGPHLHWEVIVRGVEVDGELWLKGVEVGP